VIGVVLTGMLDDGTAGLMVVSASAGIPVVQDPATGSYASAAAWATHLLPNILEQNKGMR
jgi:two-component system, chemotaxis family, protein-glutamate methylesterase/glutaminase